MAGDLPHPPAKQPVEGKDQLDVRRGVGRFAPRHTGCADFSVNELRLQITARDLQADHAALSQALVIRPRVRHPVPGFLALARFTRFKSGFVWHCSGWLYDVALLHNPQHLCNTPIRTKPFSYADAGQMHLYLNYAREHVAYTLGVTPQTVTNWRTRFLKQRLDGLLDALRPGLVT